MSEPLQGKDTHTYLMVDLYTYCSMNKQFIEGIQNGKKLI